ncbi:polyprenyl diphosphate synthase [Limnohabitans sp. Rim8]|uniref:polyprenyl diphosphate synthase n=1 Tax=Limnohabitans sp. Rim8 TaxID=1100718 RepID=UPI002617C2A3|nr:polyprenyl diphosphate synthase [Limnohabitans sp. Rim8]
MSANQPIPFQLAASKSPALPQHIAIIMDGNRRWAKSRFMPAGLGHAAGAQRVREIVKSCAEFGIPHLSLFAFSTENWKRPPDEVSALLGLFMTYLKKEIRDMNANGVRLKVLGDKLKFSDSLQELIADAEQQTAGNAGITLYICANYGGRWDMLQAVKAWQSRNPSLGLESLTETALTPCLSTADAPEVDLLIRTGGESRVSNFLLWQAAYAELFFCEELWPDFNRETLNRALVWFAGRDRRFGSSAPI